MNVELAAAVTAGLLGGIVMALFQLGAPVINRRTFDLLGMWGRLLGLGDAPAIGLVVHAAVSVAIGVLYAIGFSLAGATDYGWAWGLVGSVIHWIIAGLFVGAVPAGDDRRVAPGPFAMQLGPPSTIGFLLAHLAFGLVFGVAYFALHSAGGIQSAF